MEKTSNKTLKKILVIGAALLALVAVVAAIAIVPAAIVSAEFEEMFDKIEDINAPEIVITDMGADNNFSSARGEMLVNGEAALQILDRIDEAIDDCKYVGKADSKGSFDIRFKVSGDGATYEFFLTESEIYFVKNDKKYVFTPEDEEAKAEHKQVYNLACMFVK